MSGPGGWLHRLASLMCDCDTMAGVVDPIVADLRLELENAGSVVKRSWVRLRAYFGFWTALACCMWHRLWRGPRASCAEIVSPGRVAFTAVLTTAVVTAFLVAFAFTNYLSQEHVNQSGAHWPVYRAWLLVTPSELFRAFTYLIPQAVPIALPLGVFVVILRATVNRRPTIRLVGTLAMVVIFASAVSGFVLAEIAPRANLAFLNLNDDLHELDTGGRSFRILRGAPELRWRELREAVEHGSLVSRDFEQQTIPWGAIRESWQGAPSFPRDWEYQMEQQYWLHYCLRPALTLAPLVLALLGFAVSTFTVIGRRVLSLIVTVLFLSFFTLIDAGRLVADGVVRPVVAAWLPNIVALAMAGTLALGHVVQRRAIAQ